MPKKIEAAFARVRAPQAAIIVALIGSFVALAMWLPDARWASVARIIAAVLTGLGVGGTLMPSAVRPRAAPPAAPPPPSRRAGFGTVDVLLWIGVLAILATMTLLHGCGSTLRVHATIASVAGATLDESCSSVQTHRRAELEEAVAAHEYVEDAAAAVTEVRARWSPALDGCVLVAAAHDAWVDAITLASVSGTYDLAHALVDVGRLLAVWRPLVGLLGELGLDLPPPPDELVGLLSAGGGAQ